MLVKVLYIFPSGDIYCSDGNIRKAASNYTPIVGEWVVIDGNHILGHKWRKAKPTIMLTTKTAKEWCPEDSWLLIFRNISGEKSYYCFSLSRKKLIELDNLNDVRVPGDLSGRLRDLETTLLNETGTDNAFKVFEKDGYIYFLLGECNYTQESYDGALGLPELNLVNLEPKPFIVAELGSIYRLSPNWQVTSIKANWAAGWVAGFGQSPANRFVGLTEIDNDLIKIVRSTPKIIRVNVSGTDGSTVPRYYIYWDAVYKDWDWNELKYTWNAETLFSNTFGYAEKWPYKDYGDGTQYLADILAWNEKDDTLHTPFTVVRGEGAVPIHMITSISDVGDKYRYDDYWSYTNSYNNIPTDYEGDFQIYLNPNIYSRATRTITNKVWIDTVLQADIEDEVTFYFKGQTISISNKINFYLVDGRESSKEFWLCDIVPLSWANYLDSSNNNVDVLVYAKYQTVSNEKDLHNVSGEDWWVSNKIKTIVDFYLNINGQDYPLPVPEDSLQQQDWVRTYILNKHNEIRRQHGLEEFTEDSWLDWVADFHSTDMAENHFFAHTGSQGDTLEDRYERFEVIYTEGGENIADIGELTEEYLDQMMDDWMASSGHRANILNPDFSRIGIGYEQDSVSGTWKITVDFADQDTQTGMGSQYDYFVGRRIYSSTGEQLDPIIWNCSGWEPRDISFAFHNDKLMISYLIVQVSKELDSLSNDWTEVEYTEYQEEPVTRVICIWDGSSLEAIKWNNLSRGMCGLIVP